MFDCTHFLQSLKPLLAKRGFTICEPFIIQDYNKLMQQQYYLPTYETNQCFGIAIGNNKDLWKEFIKYIDLHSTLIKESDPLDVYTKEMIEQSMNEVSKTVSNCQYTIRYSYDTNIEKVVSMTKIAYISGISAISPKSYLCIHPLYGPWIAMRAVIIINQESTFPPPTILNSSFEDPRIEDECGKEVENICKTVLNESNTKYMPRQVWLKWLNMRLKYQYGQEWMYSPYQAIYHYSKRKIYIKKELEYYRSTGTIYENKEWFKNINHYLETTEIEINED
ncbi:hypothetical protein WA158_001131 [Blastocystis sp. Blastoise]